MALRKSADKYKMLPYRKGGPIDYASLEFDAFKKEVPPDHMEQSREIHEVVGLLFAHFTDFHRRPDVFVDTDTHLCYDPSNLNVRVAPDVYIAFGVDAEAIRPRRLYLPWEVGKAPDWVLEVASDSTRRVDLVRKPPIYAQIGIPEFWRFDPTGGRYYRFQLNGLKLVDGEYQPIELTTEPDGILKGYSEILELSLAWDNGWPRLYDPVTGTYLENWRDDRDALRAERAARQAEQRALRAERERRATDQERIRQLEEELRRLRGERPHPNPPPEGEGA